jgi:hypothetical protein
MKVVVFVVALFMASTAGAQTIDALYGVGRAFDIPSQTWMNFHAPALEVASHGFVVNVTHMLEFDTGASSETDLTLSYEQWLAPRVALKGTVAQWKYWMAFTDPSRQRSKDLRAWAEVRVRLKK